MNPPSKRRFPRISFAKADSGASPVASAFLEDPFDTCRLESTFRSPLTEHELIFYDNVPPHHAAYPPEANAAQQRDFLTHLHQTCNAPSHHIRNRLLRLAADSPHPLAIINREGKF